MLQQALTQAGAGHGQVVAIVGEAGVGKSRLVYEFIHSHHTPGWLILESASVSYGKATAYFPVVDLLKRYCHINDGDEPRTVRAKVTGQVLTLDAALQETIPALLWLLDVLPEDSPFLALDPPQRRRHTLDALKRLLLRESQVQPVLLVFEDLHWIDSETQALLDTLVESLPTARLLLLVNYRPEYQHGWGSKTYYAQLRLDPLPPASAEDFLQALLGDDPSLAPLKQLLIARTEGNPFFLEESVRTLVETGVLVGTPGPIAWRRRCPPFRYRPRCRRCWRRVSTACHPRRKRLLQTAAVIGTEVPFPLLQAIAELPEAELHRGLAHLQAAEFLYESQPVPGTGLHLQARPHPRGGIQRPLAGAAAGAARPHCRGPGGAHRGPGSRAGRATGAPRPAGGGVGQGPDVLPAGGGEGHGTVGPPRGRGILRAGAQCPPASAGDARHARAGYRSPARLALGALAIRRLGRILAVLHEAESLADGPRRSASAGTSLSLSVTPFLIMGAYDQAITAAQHALALATAGGDSVLRALANLYLGTAYQPQGDYRRAIDCFGQTVASLDGARRHERFGQVNLPAVFSRAYLAWCHAELGTFAEGRALGDEGLQIAEAVAHPSSLMYGLLGNWSIVPPPGRPAQGTSPRSNGPWAAVRKRTSRTSSPWWLRPWGRRIPWTGASPTPYRCLRRRWHRALRWKWSAFRRPVVSPWGRHRCWLAVWRRHRPSPSVRWRSPMRTRNVATRRMPCASSVTLRRGASLRRASRLETTTTRPSPWPTNSACARSWRTATSASAPYMAAWAGSSQPVPNSPPPSRCTAPWT